MLSLLHNDELMLIAGSRDWWFASIAIPLLAATIGPLANLLSIAALVTPWRSKYLNSSTRHDMESKGFSDPRWWDATGTRAVLLHDFPADSRAALHNHVPPVRPEETYSQGFWYAIIAAALYLISSMILMVNMLGYFFGHYPQHFTLTDHQRTLMLQTMLFFIWLGGGAAVFARVCGWSYVDAIYFCDVTILTVGFGDYYPPNDTGRGLVFPFSVGGIVMLGLVVNSIRQFTNDLNKDKVIKRHVEKTRIRTIGRAATASLELRERRRSSVGGPNPQQSRGIAMRDLHATPGGIEKLPRSQSLTKRLTNGVRTVTRVRTKKPKIVLLKEEKDRFNAMREIQRNTKVFKRWYNLCISVTAFGLLWCVGAVVFWKAEHREQGMSYFRALYFCYVSLLTIGYGDLSPKSNAGKPFFLVWSLVAVPTMTILIHDMGETVIASFQRGTFHVADWTVLPKSGLWLNFLQKHPWLLLWIQRKAEEKAAEKRVAEGFPGPEGVIGMPRVTLEELARGGTDVEDLPRNLSLAIRQVASHLHAKPPQRYSYEEWAEYTRLIRFSSMSPEDVEEDEEEEGLINWDWMGEDSPMLAEQNEAEWLLDRLCESLARYMKSQTRKARREGNCAAAGEEGGERDLDPIGEGGFYLAPYSSNPAVFLQSDAGSAVDPDRALLPPPCTNHSDDLEVLHVQQVETTAAKKRPSRDRTSFRRVAPKTLTAWYAEIPPSLQMMAMIQESSRVTAAATAGDIYPEYDRGKERTGPAPNYWEFRDKAKRSSSPQASVIMDASREVIGSPVESQHKSTSRVGPFIMDDDDSGDELRSPTSQSSSRSNAVSISRPPGEGNGLDEAPPISLLPASSLGRKLRNMGKKRYSIQTCSGKSFEVSKRLAGTPLSFERLISSRSLAAPGRARKSYYGVDVHNLLDENAGEAKMSADQTSTRRPEDPTPSIEVQAPEPGSCGKTLLWTEKYRAKTFIDLIGDERTHRSVLRWFKGWDPIVFTRQGRTKTTGKESNDDSEERGHRKILLLTGPPGLGKTTLAHVAARQAGYEVLEINASDERSESVVRGRIRDSLGTENVKILRTKSASGKFRKAGKPVCVVVDEVDGVVSGASGTTGGGEGGFIKALLDLVALDEKNSSSSTINLHTSTAARKKKKGDNFRFLRPLVLICNDIYHPSLKPIRRSSAAEIIHVRKPPLSMVISRMKTIFEKEGFSCDGDGVRRLCEATWGLSGRREVGSTSIAAGEGDIRRVMVVGEWVAGKLRSSLPSTARLTRKWLEQHMLGDLSDGGTGAGGLGRGGYKEIVQRVFLEGAGLPKPIDLGSVGGTPGEYDIKIGVSEFSKRRAMEWLRDTVDSGGEYDRVITDCFSTYLSQPYQDDTLLSKPNAVNDWLHFHDTLNSKIFTDQEWELTSYLSQPVLSFHHLFASSARYAQVSNFGQARSGENDDGDPAPFAGPKADFTAHEALKSNRALLLAVQSSLSIPLLHSFRSPEEIATDLVPYLNKILTPDIKPVVVGGSGDQRGVASVRKENEREMVRRAVGVMAGVGVTFERGRVEMEMGGRDGGWVYRMEPPIDALATFQTNAMTPGAAPAPVRYAVRQVLDQEYQKEGIRQRNEARQARYKAKTTAGDSPLANVTQKDTATAATTCRGERPRTAGAKRDFFGRIVNEAAPKAGGEGADEPEGSRKKRKSSGGGGQENMVWISFHEGFSNAVRKPITLEDILREL
ncbi:hypothetical protein GP486_001403 [Trichoglossum hirsutum]|uniref:AAA+ ATPase domain-containing protein n=1 Tax=Trichoglossum hirsutum TaxID=265104 RepID=A0A9P8RT52_9PEZI|nr:hypothetical protein GP486_001403 [Trichoglossum hirsutum]